MNQTHPTSAVARKARKLAVQVLIAVAIIIPIRECVAAPYRVQTASLAPELPQGSFVLVYRLASDLQPGDIFAYRADSKTLLARFESLSGSTLRANRNNQEFDVERQAIIGKVVAATR